MTAKDQVRHFRVKDKVYQALRVRAVKRKVAIGDILEELVFPKKPISPTETS